MSRRLLKQPSITPILARGGKRLYRLDHDYCYAWHAEGCRWRICVPAGFEYDGASNPWWLWTITRILPDGLARAAALIHDWLYAHKGRVPTGSFSRQIQMQMTMPMNGSWRPVSVPWQRVQADKLFANMLDEAGETKLRRRIMYLGVRLCGWVYWRS